ncbi:hypothetical protein ID866_7261 [Astraeus odoratus]|nr:hypothetical protein ID866_7261 [Astraeus odoratus]
MDDDTEILDWGNEDEERNVGSGEQRSFAAEEDAVSLGGDEEDDFLAHQSRVPQGTNRGQTPSRSTESARKRSGSESFPSDTSPRRQQQEKESDMSAPDQSAALPRPVTHALPPKPTVTTMSFVHPSHPSIIEATAMASQSDRNKRNGGGSKARSHDNIDALPQGWEIKLSRSTGEVYYYNPRTEESTWTRPGTASFRDAQNYHSEEPLDRGFLNRNGDIPSRTGLSDSDTRDVIVEPRQRERESRQHDPGTASSDHDRRHSEDTDKLSTLSAKAPPEVEDGASRERLAKPWE